MTSAGAHGSPNTGSSSSPPTLLLGIGWFVWFIFTAKSVQLVIDPAQSSTSISGGFDLALGGIYVLREGVYELHAQAEGYAPLVAPLTIGEERNQSYHFALTPLPGRINFDTTPVPADVLVDQVVIGTTPLHDVDVAAGEHKVVFRNARYQNKDMTIDVEGKRVAQSFSATLLPNWATITTTSQPDGAAVFVDEQEIGTTPGAFEIVAGVHELRLKRAGFKTWRSRVEVVAQQDQTLPSVALEAADGLITIVSKPAGAGVTLNGSYRGETPLELALSPGTRYDARVTRAGYETARRQFQLRPNEEQTLQVELAALTGKVLITTEPKTSEIFIDGTSRGTGSQTLTLPARPQSLEVRLPNYATYSTRFTPQPGLTQEINVRLLTLAEARQQAMKPRVKVTNGPEIVLLSPGQFSMGSSRREPGRRANEVLHDVTLTRMFYLATTEVTNAQFKKFAAEPRQRRLRRPQAQQRRPAGRESHVGRRGAVLQLPVRARSPAAVLQDRRHKSRRHQSNRDGVSPADRGRVGMGRADHARHDGRTTFSVGRQLSADRSLRQLRRPLRRPSRRSSHIRIQRQPDRQRAGGDVPGRRARVVRHRRQRRRVDQRLLRNSGESPARDPLGPDSGDYHVIRGSSWMNGTITELRLTFRDYGTDGRADLGFRIARFAE